MNDDLIEKLAAGEHQQWADWANDILNTEAVSSARAARWIELIRTPYEELSEEMKEKDRREVYLRSKPALDRIAELEAALVEARAQYLLTLDDNPGCSAWDFDDLTSKFQEEYKREARDQLHSEGKL